MYEGEPVMRNKHHIWSPKKSFTTPVERRVHLMGAHIVYGVNVVDHNELNATGQHPPKLTHDEYCDLYNFVLNHHNPDHKWLEGMEWDMIWAQNVGNAALLDNLELQYHFISGDYRR